MTLTPARWSSRTRVLNSATRQPGDRPVAYDDSEAKKPIELYPHRAPTHLASIARQGKPPILVAYHARRDRSILDKEVAHRSDAPRPQALRQTEYRQTAGGRRLNGVGDHALLLGALIAVDYRGRLPLDLAQAPTVVHREGAGEPARSS